MISKETYKYYRQIIRDMVIELNEMYKTPIDEIKDVDYKDFQSYWWKLKKIIDGIKKIK